MRAVLPPDLLPFLSASLLPRLFVMTEIVNLSLTSLHGELIIESEINFTADLQILIGDAQQGISTISFLEPQPSHSSDRETSLWTDIKWK